MNLDDSALGVGLCAIIFLTFILVFWMFCFLPGGSSLFGWLTLPFMALVVGSGVLWLLVSSRD